ncbi:hypothetical protein M3Y99_01976400 [Aphelenchoides fujianensis]|nr:hypothetical protein M3Y99_01976400 [Aphelenchoides fujianensis]
MRIARLLSALLLLAGLRATDGLLCYQGMQNHSLPVTGTPTACPVPCSSCVLTIDGTSGMATRSCQTANCTLNGIPSYSGFCQRAMMPNNIFNTYCCCNGDGCNFNTNFMMLPPTSSSPPSPPASPLISAPIAMDTNPPLRCFQGIQNSSMQMIGTPTPCFLPSSACTTVVDGATGLTTRSCQTINCTLGGVVSSTGFCNNFTSSSSGATNTYCCCCPRGWVQWKLNLYAPNDALACNASLGNDAADFDCFPCVFRSTIVHRRPGHVLPSVYFGSLHGLRRFNLVRCSDFDPAFHILATVHFRSIYVFCFDFFFGPVVQHVTSHHLDNAFDHQHDR